MEEEEEEEEESLVDTDKGSEVEEEAEAGRVALGVRAAAGGFASGASSTSLATCSTG